MKKNIVVLVWPSMCWKLIICPDKICPPPSPPQNHIIIPLVEICVINLIMRENINMLSCCVPINRPSFDCWENYDVLKLYIMYVVLSIFKNWEKNPQKRQNKELISIGIHLLNNLKSLGENNCMWISICATTTMLNVIYMYMCLLILLLMLLPDLHLQPLYWHKKRANRKSECISNSV